MTQTLEEANEAMRTAVRERLDATEPEDKQGPLAGCKPAEEAAAKEHKILAGRAEYAEIARGQAMMEENSFAKAIVDAETEKVLGFHIIGPQASILIQEVINLMYTEDRSWRPISGGMHIHPALTELIHATLRHLHEV